MSLESGRAAHVEAAPSSGQRTLADPEAGTIEANAYFSLAALHHCFVSRPASIGLVLIAIGVAFHTFVQGHDFATSLYIVAQTVTTVGYGDFAPTSPQSKMFMVFCALALLVCASVLLSTVQHKAVKVQEEFLLRAMGRKWGNPQAAAMDGAMPASKKAHGNAMTATSLFLSCVAFGTIFFRLYEHCTCSFGHSHVSGCDPSSFATCEATGGQVKTWVDTLYMSVITLTTIGYGDFTPQTRLGRSVACVWIVLGVGATFNFLDKVSHLLFFNHFHRKFVVEADSFNEEVLKLMDVDQDGHVSRSEFLCFQLLKHSMVDRSVLNMVLEEYDKFAKDSGGIVTVEAMKTRGQPQPHRRSFFPWYGAHRSGRKA